MAGTAGAEPAVAASTGAAYRDEPDAPLDVAGSETPGAEEAYKDTIELQRKPEKIVTQVESSAADAEEDR